MLSLAASSARVVGARAAQARLQAPPLLVAADHDPAVAVAEVALHARRAQLLLVGLERALDRVAPPVERRGRPAAQVVGRHERLDGDARAGRDVVLEPALGLRARVLAPEHAVEVHARHETLGAQRHDEHHERAEPGARRAQLLGGDPDRVAGEHAQRGIGGQQPAAEEARLVAEEEEQEQRERDEQQPAPPVAPQHQHPARQRGHGGEPAEAPGERAEVVPPAGDLVLAELAAGGLARLAADLAQRGRVLDDRERVEQRERDAAGRARGDQAEQRPAQLAAIGEDAQDGRDAQRDEHRARRVLGRDGDADRRAREHPVAPAALLVDEQAGDERDRDGRHRDHVVERVLGVEDGQERDRHQRGRREPGAAVREARPGPVDERDHERADQRDDDARGEVGGLGIRAELRDEVTAEAEAQLEHHEQQVGQRGRVLEVARVERAAEHVDRHGDEVQLLVRVVGVRQPVVEVPEAQRERQDDDGAQDPPRPHASTAGGFPPPP